MGLLSKAGSRLGSRFRNLAKGVAFLASVAADREAPRRARLSALAVMAYALLPVDVVPDPTMVGLLDDVVVLKLGVPGVRRLVPEDVREAQAKQIRRWVVILGVAWLASLAVGLYVLYRLLA